MNSKSNRWRTQHDEASSLLGSEDSGHTAYASTANASYQPRQEEPLDGNEPGCVTSGVHAPTPVPMKTDIVRLIASFEKRQALFWLLSLGCFVLGWALRELSYPLSQGILDPAVRDRVRAGWEMEYQRHQVQVERMQNLTVQWASEVQTHNAARSAMQAERSEWNVERKKWEQECEEREKIRRAERQLELERKKREAEKEKEKEEKEKAGIKWATPQPDPHCLRYGARKWTARLENAPPGFDPILICRETKGFIHGRWVLPDNCENKGVWSGTIATWYVDFEEAGCHTFWIEHEDKGCTTQGSGKRQFQARLDNLRPGDDWLTMCSSTPAEFHGLKFNGPDACNDWGWKGFWGVWFIEDGTCY